MYYNLGIIIGKIRFLLEKTEYSRRGDKMANNGHGLGFEQKLWSAADKLRNNMCGRRGRRWDSI